LAAKMRYEVFVKFKSDDKIKVEGDKITISVSSKPIEGAANLEIIKKLSKYFCVPSSNVKIVHGLKSKKKIVEIIT
jgi:uncharacterized protein (TIGR00251 family)